MEDENAFQIADTMKKEKKNSASQEDWKDYAYGGKSLLDDTGETNGENNESNENMETGKTTVDDQTQQEDWKDYAYGGKSLLDNTGENNNIKQESSKTTRLEKKRNLVIGYVPPVESTKIGKLDNPEENNNIKQESSCEEGVS